MIRKRCRERGHKYRQDWMTASLPYVFCRRWFCSGSAVAPWVVDADPQLARRLHAAIPEEER